VYRDYCNGIYGSPDMTDSDGGKLAFSVVFVKVFNALISYIRILNKDDIPNPIDGP